MSALAAKMDGLRMNRSEREAAEAFLRVGDRIAELIRRVLAI
jgi:hypothetical protein